MTAAELVKVAVIAVSLGLDVFAVSVGVGIRGVEPILKWRIGTAFTVAEVSMTLIGVGLGNVAGHLIGAAAGYIGFVALIGVGTYMTIEALRSGDAGGLDLARGWGLFLSALSISLDSLGIGFSILYIGAPLIVSLVCIAVVAASSTALGLTLGRAVGSRAEDAAALWAGIVLIATGVVFAGLKLAGGGH